MSPRDAALRRRLSALDDDTPISLDTLPPGEAAELLARLTGRTALDPKDPAVAELARLCGFLPPEQPSGNPPDQTSPRSNPRPD
jgi:hypothetical protein